MSNVGKHIAVVGFGNDRHYIKQSNADEVWGINHINRLFDVDRLFNMHDLRLTLQAPDLDPDLRKHITQSLDKATDDGTMVVSCYSWDRYPIIKAYPIEEIVQHFGIDFFTCCASYMIAYAVATGVTRIDLFGVTATENYVHQNPCLSLWCGIALGMRVDIRSFGSGAMLMRTSPSPTAPVIRQWRYGYDTLPPGIESVHSEYAGKQFGGLQ